MRGVGPEHGLGQLERNRRIEHVRIQPMRRTKRDAGEVAQRARGIAHLVLDGDNRVIEPVVVDVTERDHDGLTTELDRGEGLLGLTRWYVQDLTDLVAKRDLIETRAEAADAEGQ